MTITSILLMIFSTYISETVSAWSFVSNQKKLSSSTHSALFKMVKEIKRIKSNASITTYTSTEVEFIDIDDEIVNFSQSGEALVRNNDLLLNNLQTPGGLLISYLDANGGVATGTAEMRVVRIRLSTAKGKGKVVVESAARIRNLE